jgi:ABC-type sulfate transport system permease component
MQGQPDRVEQFTADLANLRITDPSTARDQLAVRAGLVGLAIGVVLPVVAYGMSHSTTNALAQRDALVLAIIGLSFAVAGAALFLKGALAGFLRFWLVRDLHERRAQTDRLLDRLGGGDQAPESELP